MEGKQNATNGPAAETETAVAQEVSSTTQVTEINKRSLRVQTWRKIEETKTGLGFNAIFNKIPNFVDSTEAAKLLATTQHFKDAKNIKVNIDRAQDAVQLETLQAGKDLYVRPVQGSNALFAKVELGADADEAAMKRVIKIQNSPERVDVSVENKVELDMVVIGSVVVSSDGYRIGRGNGFVDLDIGILIETGAITPKTIIVTTVHDNQVVDSLPTNLFQKYDTPVDLIVTPTKVIEVSKRLPRPSGLFWELISERRIKIVPVLQVLKEIAEKSGPVTLKSEDTDVESNSRRRPQQQRRRKFRSARKSKSHSQTEGENGHVDDNDDDATNLGGRRGRFNNRRKPAKLTKKTNDAKDEEATRKREKAHRKRTEDTYCVRISNIVKGIRVKDLKAELRNRNCNPKAISWKGHKGRCFLIFPKNLTDVDEDMNNVLKSLNDLSLTYQDGETEERANLQVELLPSETKAVAIENSAIDTTIDTTTPTTTTVTNGAETTTA